MQTYVIGGMSDEIPRRDDIEVWNEKNKTWSVSKGLKMKHGRSHFEAIAVPSRVVCK